MGWHWENFSYHHLCCSKTHLFIHYFCFKSILKSSLRKVSAHVSTLQVFPWIYQEGYEYVCWLLWWCLSAYFWMQKWERLLQSSLTYDARLQNTHNGVLACRWMSKSLFRNMNNEEECLMQLWSSPSLLFGCLFSLENIFFLLWCTLTCWFSLLLLVINYYSQIFFFGCAI